jgi:hypothetical protein
MDVELFAGIAVSDLERAIAWYSRFFGGTESFEPNDTERVWTVAEHRYLYVELEPEHAGHGMVTKTAYARSYIATQMATRSVSAAPRSSLETAHGTPRRRWR